jgi:thioredoxin 1
MSKLKFIKLVTAEWCGPCHVIKNILARKGLKVDVIDLDESPELIKEFGIRSVPTLLIKQSNGEFELIQGSEDIIKAIESNK